MSFTLAYDVTARFYSTVPQGFQLAGYDTGSDGIAWTQEMWEGHPGAVHIDQAPDLDGDCTADVFDVESGAVPVGSSLIPKLARGAQASYNAGTRPGQRIPALYQSASNVTANVNALLAGGVKSGVGLFIADWTGTSAQGVAELAAASGPFPVIGVQFRDDGDWDSDVFSTDWLDTVSGDGWVFGPVRSADFWPGRTTFGLTFYSPGTPQKLGVGSYQVAVFEGPATAFGKGSQVKGYPVQLQKGEAGTLQSYEGHGLAAGTQYTAGVRAVATSGGHAGPWVKSTFETSS